jgi:hypothetical protein
MDIRPFAKRCWVRGFALTQPTGTHLRSRGSGRRQRQALSPACTRRQPGGQTHRPSTTLPKAHEMDGLVPNLPEGWAVASAAARSSAASITDAAHAPVAARRGFFDITISFVPAGSRPCVAKARGKVHSEGAAAGPSGPRANGEGKSARVRGTGSATSWCATCAPRGSNRGRGPPSVA